jgi:hypothetical protein
MMATNGSLRYVTADHVDTPTGSLAGTVVIGSGGERLGNLHGIVIDPLERRAPYLIVAARKHLRTHRYLVPLAPSRIESDRHALHVDIASADLPQCPEWPRSGMPEYSDDDLIAAFVS